MRRPQKLQVFNGETKGITKIHCINNKNVNVLFTKGSGRKKIKIKSNKAQTIPILHAKIPILRNFSP